jgi:hypothetical protein
MTGKIRFSLDRMASLVADVRDALINCTQPLTGAYGFVPAAAR